MKTKIPFFILVASLFLLFYPDISRAQKSHKIMLAGYKMDPPVSTGASGMVTVTLLKDTLRIKGDFSDLMNNYYGAYIIGEIRGKAGNVMHKLKADLNDEKTGGTFHPKKNTFVLTPGQKKLLDAGRLYITVASWDHQRGEIRAKIPPFK